MAEGILECVIRRRLELTVDAAVSLLQPLRVPRKVHVDQVVAPGLKVDALSCRVGADQDTRWPRLRVRVEGSLQCLAPVLCGGTGADADARTGRCFQIEVSEDCPKAALQPAAGGFPLGEQDPRPISVQHYFTISGSGRS
jgi:hypothetical protein